MNDNHKSLHDESDDALDRAIRAITAQSSPADVKNRVIETAAAWQRQAHLAVGDARRGDHDILGAEEKEAGSGFEALARSLGPIERLVSDQEGPQSSVHVGVSNNHFIERVKNMVRTHKRLIATAATLAALAVGLVICVSLISFSHPAYALEQTAQANNQIKTCHVRCSGGGVGEAWIEMNSDGTPLRARMDLPKTEDGAKVVILTEDKAEVWFKDKHGHLFVTEKGALARVKEMQKQFDPKLAFEELQAMKASGKVEVATQEPAKTGEPITLTVTPKDKSDQRAVYTVNPSTKLVERMTTYRQHDGQWEQVGAIEYLDYNKEIDPSVFQLDLPKDVTTVDQINQNIGLEKGDLTNAEIAAKVAREFFEALIAADYRKAGLLYEGIPAEKMKESFGPCKFHRIVEIGEPVPGPIPEMKALRVPITVEFGDQKERVQQTEVRVPVTDDETAKKAARGLFEALIKEDVAAVREILATGVVSEGFSAKNADKVEQFLKTFKLLRVVEVGKPIPNPETKSLVVPIKVEMKMKVTTRKFAPFIRPVYGHPDRWGICGGI